MERTKKIKEYVIITLGTLIVSMAVYFFLLPSNVVVGSLSGLVMVLATFKCGSSCSRLSVYRKGIRSKDRIHIAFNADIFVCV